MTSNAEISGYSVKAVTENSADKSREVKPVIWTGFLGAVNDIALMKELGANLIQTEIPMYNIVVDPDTQDVYKRQVMAG